MRAATASAVAAHALEAAAGLALTRLNIEAARQDPAIFVRLVLRDEETGKVIDQQPFHDEWQDELSKHDRLVLWSSIEFGKSSQITVGRVLWELGRNPSLRVLIATSTVRAAQKIIRTLSKYIETSEALRAVFPHLQRAKDHRAPWNMSALTIERPVISKDPSVQACGVRGRIIGSRVDLLVFDDVIDGENTSTSEKRDGVFDWLRQTPLGRLTEHARVWVVVNAWHPKDAAHRMVDELGYQGRRYPALTPEGIPRWPRRWSLKRLARKKRDLGSLEFSRQLLCIARDEGASRFRKAWLDAAMQAGMGLRFVRRAANLPPGFAIFTGVDLAVSRKDSADLTVLATVLCYPPWHPSRPGARQVLCLESGRWSAHEIVARIDDHAVRYGGLVIVENTACFVPGTRVLTSTGYKPIEAIQAGDLVWTHKGRWRPVIGAISSPPREGCTVVTAKAVGTLPVRATPNHWFWLREKGRTPGYKGGHHRPVGEPCWVSYGFRDKPAYAALACPKWPSLTPTLTLPATASGPAAYVEVTEALALVLGLFMAEGHATKRQVYWTLGARDVYLADLIERAIRPLVKGVISRRRTGGVVRLVVNSTSLASALHWGTFDKKCPPLAWMGWPLPVRLAVVRGWLLGDGCVKVGHKAKRPGWYLQGCTVSRDWALFVRATLAEIGATVSLSRRSPRKGVIDGRRVSCKELFCLSLTRDGSKRLRSLMTSPEEAQRWASWWAGAAPVLHKHTGHVVFDGLHAWGPVPGLETSSFEAWDGPVHNLVVEEDESYTVEDFIVHNAQDYLLQFARRLTRATLLPFTTGKNKADPSFGVESLAAELEAGKWIFPSYDGQAAPPEIEALVAEFLYYDPKGHTGDRIMALWMAREAARRWERSLVLQQQAETTLAEEAGGSEEASEQVSPVVEQDVGEGKERGGRNLGEAA